MPIIGNVGRRSLKVRIITVSTHVVLILGATTMVYPLLVMLSGSVKSQVDSRTLSAVPAYFTDDQVLFRKWLESKYNESSIEYSLCNRERALSFDAMTFPEKPVRQRYADWNAFLDESGAEINEFHRSLGHAWARGIHPEMTRKFVDELKSESDIGGDLSRLNNKYGTTFAGWDALYIPILSYLRRKDTGELNSYTKRMMEFMQRQDRHDFNYYSLDSFFVEQTLKPKYANVRRMNAALGTTFQSWADVTLTRHVPADGLKEDWCFFVKNRLNLQFIAVAAPTVGDYRAFLEGKYRSISVLNARYGAVYERFGDIPLMESIPRSGIPLADWDYFVQTVAKPEHMSIRSAEFMYRDFLRRKYASIQDLIAAHRLGVESLDQVELAERFPAGHVAREDDWSEFVHSIADRGWARPDFAASDAWVEHLTKPYVRGQQVDWAALNHALGTMYKSLNDISLPEEPPRNSKLADQWAEFVREACPKELLIVDRSLAGSQWQEFIHRKYASTSELNQRYGWVPDSFETVAMPISDLDYFSFQKVKRHAFWEFLTRNYAAVFSMMLYNGRAIINTVIYCGLAVLAALLVNPLAAYALSRYKPPSQYKLLLFLMLTMAFPPMVLGIPNFLLIRKLGLLNTFAALILPGMANGYLIFLLKGFFDSLPRELYESAQLDGASEWTMFWRITMSTSKPILAVVALSAFTAAYSNFMLAFILCQDSKMWTMMVHIYQLQQRSSQGVCFAALVVAAVPTLLVFIFCQNIIMRGIVVPTEK